MSLSAIKKVVVTGPESTGKSTLSKALAASLQTSWVPEFAREYLHTLARPYTEEDLLYIASQQMMLEDKIAFAARDILICDTNLYVIKVWSEHKFGYCHEWILEQIAVRHYDMYLLTDIDMPWEEDPLREHPAPEMRRYFYNIYLDLVQHSGVPWQQITGGETTRLTTALQAIKTIQHPPY